MFLTLKSITANVLISSPTMMVLSVWSAIRRLTGTNKHQNAKAVRLISTTILVNPPVKDALKIIQFSMDANAERVSLELNS